jgi:hypothetical protein
MENVGGAAKPVSEAEISQTGVERKSRRAAVEPDKRISIGSK